MALPSAQVVQELNRIAQNDNKIAIFVESLLEMKSQSSYGDIRVTIQAGKIQHVIKTESR